MAEIIDNHCFELISVIVNCGQGSKVLNMAKSHGIKGGTVFLGRGTVKSKLLDFLDIRDIRKEIVFMIADTETAESVLDFLDSEIHFAKPHHGIAFSSFVDSIFGANTIIKSNNIFESEGANKFMYNAIFTIVEKGRGEDVIDAATKAGSRGGTIINARGSGIHEKSKVFMMDIEPEKEIVLILAEKNLTETIITSIRKDLELDKPGNGIVFVQELNRTFGLY